MDKQLSKKHIYWLAPILTFFFTYAGVEEGLLEVLQHDDFWVNIIFNGIQVFLLLCLIYYLHFKKQLGLIKSFLISITALIFFQVIEILLIEYEAEDFTELYSITLPFGSLIIFGINFYYSKYKEAKAITDSIELKKTETFWLHTSQGKQAIKFDDFRYAFLNDIHLRLRLQDEEVNSFVTLKELEIILKDRLDCFRLNKQYLTDHSGVLSFKSLKDGRLTVKLFDTNETIVSKNKAANFKHWIENTSELRL